MSRSGHPTQNENCEEEIRRRGKSLLAGIQADAWDESRGTGLVRTRQRTQERRDEEGRAKSRSGKQAGEDREA
jgi:hypothetical protein